MINHTVHFFACSLEDVREALIAAAHRLARNLVKDEEKEDAYVLLSPSGAMGVELNLELKSSKRSAGVEINCNANAESARFIDALTYVMDDLMMRRGNEGTPFRPKAEAASYAFSPITHQAAASSPMATKPTESKSQPANQTKDKTGNTKSWIWRGIGALGIYCLFFTPFGDSILDEISSSLDAKASISDYDCDSIARAAKKLELQNMFGGRFKILAIDNAREVERGASKVACSADMTLSNGERNSMQMSVSKSSSGSEFFIEVKPN